MIHTLDKFLSRALLLFLFWLSIDSCDLLFDVFLCSDGFSLGRFGFLDGDQAVEFSGSPKLIRGALKIDSSVQDSNKVVGRRQEQFNVMGDQYLFLANPYNQSTQSEYILPYDP